MSSFEDLRVVDNFYQTSLFFPMPTVIISTLCEDGTWPYKESWDTSTPPLQKIASNWAGYDAVKKVFLMKKFGAVDFI